MQYVARKVSKNKWILRSYLGRDAIAADAITGGCIRTQSDALSVWECASGQQDDVEPVVLALAAAGSHLDTIDIVILPKDELEGLDVARSEGNTPVQDLRPCHVDIQHLDTKGICQLARSIAAAVRSENELRCRRFRESEVERILRDAILTGRLNHEDLGEGLRNRLKMPL